MASKKKKSKQASQRTLAERMKEEVEVDEKSVYSVDPDMYEKIGIRKPKKGEEMNNFDAEKIISFQLEKDLPKIVTNHGTYDELNKDYFLGEKVAPESYEKFGMHITSQGNLVRSKNLGAKGTIGKVAKYAEDISWRETTKPYGIIAAKRYAEYLANLPKGPSEAELRAVEQKKQDEELWRLVKDGRDPEYIDGIKIRKKGWKEQSDVEAQLRLAEAQLKEVQAVEAYDDAIRLNNFAVNRKLSTKPEHIKSINNWHKGVHYPCDLTSGFPHGFGDINTRPRDTTIDIDTPFVKYDSNKYSSKEYVPTDGTGDFEAEFNKYFNEICYQRACAYLEMVKKVKKEQEKARRKEEKRRTRQESFSGMPLADSVAVAAPALALAPAPLLAIEAPAEERVPAPVSGDGSAPGIAASQTVSGSGTRSGSRSGVVRGSQGSGADDVPVRMVTGNALEDDSMNGGEEQLVGVGEHGFSASAGSYATDTGAGTGTGTAPKTKSHSRTRSNLLPPLEGITERPSLEQSSTASVSFANSVSIKDENAEITVKNLDDGRDNGGVSAEPSLGDVSNITGIGGNTMSKIPGTGVRPGSALREGGAIGVRPGSATPAVPALTLPALGVEQVPNANGANVTFDTSGAAAAGGGGGMGVDVMAAMGTDPGADPHKKPPPLKKRLRRAMKGVLKTAGSGTRAFFRGIRRGVRFTYNMAATHGPVIAEKAFTGGCSAASTSYLFIRDNTVGPPIKPKKAYLPLPKGTHWNSVPKLNKRPKIIPEMSKTEARRASMSAKTLKLEAIKAEQDALDGEFEEEGEGGGKGRRGRRGSTDSGAISLDSSVVSEDSLEDYDAKGRNKKGSRKRTRRKQGLFMTIFKAIFETIFGRPPPKESLMEKRAREKEKQANVKLKENVSNKAAMDLIFRQRAVQRKSEAFYDKWFGIGGEINKDDREYTVDNLIAATRRAKYNSILDMLDGDYDSIGPNDRNEDGESAFYVALMMVLSNEQNESAETELKEDMNFFERMRLKFSRGTKLMQLDLIVNLFLFKGGDVNFIRVDKATDGRALMHEAAEQGSVDMLKWLVNKKGNINILSTVCNSTPLMLAAAGGHINAVMYLLGQGAVAHVNRSDDRGMTALHYAAIFGAPEHADVLMICGADKNIRSKLNRLPVEDAKARNRPEMVIKIQLYKPPFSMRQEKMAYLEKVYGDNDKDDDDGTATATGTVHTGSVVTAPA